MILTITNIHSFIDVITNSSSELYTSVTKSTLRFVEGLIDYHLSQLGLELTSKDVCIIKRVKSNPYEGEDTYVYDITIEFIESEHKDVVKNLFYYIKSIIDSIEPIEIGNY